MTDYNIEQEVANLCPTMCRWFRWLPQRAQRWDEHSVRLKLKKTSLVYPYDMAIPLTVIFVSFTVVLETARVFDWRHTSDSKIKEPLLHDHWLLCSMSRALLQERGIPVSSSSGSSPRLLEKSCQSFTAFVIITSPYTLMELGQGTDCTLPKKALVFYKRPPKDWCVGIFCGSCTVLLHIAQDLWRLLEGAQYLPCYTQSVQNLINL